MKVLLLLLLFYVSNPDVAEEPVPETSIKAPCVGSGALRTRGLILNVDDLKRAESFYLEKLGFARDASVMGGDRVALKTDSGTVVLLAKAAKLRKNSDTDTGVSFTLQVNDLENAMARMREAGVEFAESKPRKEGVGNAIYIRDPFGRKISLMHQTITKVDPFKEPRIYNFGFYIPEMSAARDFYSGKLGFVVRSERYLPLDLPLGHADGTFGFMLHQRASILPFKSEYPTRMPANMVLFETDDLDAAIANLSRQQVKVVESGKVKDGETRRVVIEDPFGNVSVIEERSK